MPLHSLTAVLFTPTPGLTELVNNLFIDLSTVPYGEDPDGPLLSIYFIDNAKSPNPEFPQPF